MYIRIGTRGSKLAIAQAREVYDRLREAFPEHDYEIVVISTKCDKKQNEALKKNGEKGIFDKEN